jgi:acyl dehydratase
VTAATDLAVGTVHEVVVVDDLTRTQIVQYAGVSGDFNPLHSDEVYATQVAGNPTVMAHGMLVMGLAGKALTDYFGDGRLTQFGGRFKASAWPGDTLTARLTITAVHPGEGSDPPSADVDVEVVNADGVAVFGGTASAQLDPPA